VVAHSSWDDGLEPVEVIEARAGGFAIDQLERQIGFVALIDLINGTQLTGVIRCVSATSLIIECWDSSTHTTNGDLSTVTIEAVRRVSVP
jgi:hypothetical protein